MARAGNRKKARAEEQAAALPLRLDKDGSLQVLLVTSRETQRWVLPKGNLMKGMSRAETAAVEAEEEAGIAGRVVSKPYCRYDYWKRRSDAFYLCKVDVFLLVVTREDLRWKEEGERRRLWMSPVQACDMVIEPGLQSIFHALAADETVAELVRSKEEQAGQPGWTEAARLP